MQKYDYAVYIGRFQPFHNAHLQNVENGLSIAKKVLVLIGSAGSARNIRNPFTYDERFQMIYASIVEKYGVQVATERVVFKPVRDFLYNDNDWVAEVQGVVFDEIDKFDEDLKVCLVGSRKSDTYYLDLFPQWNLEQIEEIPLSAATRIRESYFNNGGVDYRFLDTPEAVKNFLKGFSETETYKNLCEEFKYIEEYKKPYKNLPFPPIFVTVDSVVFCNGHVLLVKRKGNPGKGQWALPGGFIGQDERIEDATIRELKEETRIEIHKNIIRGSFVSNRVFDAPGRSLRGRTITHASLYVLRNIKGLPNVKGSDDAEKAKWFPFNEFYEMRGNLMEDHWDIVTHFMGMSR